MTDEPLFDAVRRAIDAQGGAKAVARALDVSDRAVQRAKAGDASPELARDIISATRAPLWAIERLAKVLADDAPRASVRRLQVFTHIARQGSTTKRDVCEAVDGDPNGTAAHQHIAALIRMGLVEVVTRLSHVGAAGGSGPIVIQLTEAGWKALGLGVGPPKAPGESPKGSTP